jgi:flavin reductase (DIM6/NTAB) family NADH-FMN oxidoreductase RutF/rubredoxin
MVGETLFKVTYGMYIVSSRDGDSLNGLIINTANQVTSSPPQVSINISKKNLTHDLIRKSRVFSISILRSDTPLNFIGNWGFKSGREKDKFQDINYKFAVTGAPIVIDHAIGYMDLKLVGELEVSTHTIFVGEVVESEIINDGEPLTYNYYRDVKGGQSSKNAPTYSGWADKPRINKDDHTKWVCNKCGYIYDPLAGDLDRNITPFTPFLKLPDGWVCPLCKAQKSDFSELE